MTAFLKLVEESYGGVEKYLEKYLGFIPEDISIIRRHLLKEEKAEGTYS